MRAHGLLDRMQFAVADRKPLDGGERMPVGLHCEHQAGTNRHAVEQDGAGAANAVLAADMGAGEL